MNKRILTLFAAVAVMALSLTSCLSSSNDDPSRNYTTLTRVQKQAAVVTMNGTYNCTLRYYKAQSTRVDSIKNTVRIFAADTTATVSMNLPMSMFNTWMGADSAKVSGADLQLNGLAMPYPQQMNEWVKQGITSSYYNCAGTTVPKANEQTGTVNGKEGEHSYSVEFYINVPLGNFSPMIYSNGSLIEGYLLVKSIKVDETNHPVASPIYFIGKK